MEDLGLRNFPVGVARCARVFRTGLREAEGFRALARR